MSDLANILKTGRQPQHKMTTAQLAMGAILAILIVAQLMLVARNRATLDTAAQLAPFGIFAP
jgi:hypothetical protein